MKVYICITFAGHWPVGTAAVVVARDVDEARKLLASELSARGLKLSDSDELVEVDTKKRAAVVLRDGDY